MHCAVYCQWFASLQHRLRGIHVGVNVLRDWQGKGEDVMMRFIKTICRRYSYASNPS